VSISLVKASETRKPRFEKFGHSFPLPTSL